MLDTKLIRKDMNDCIRDVVDGLPEGPLVRDLHEIDDMVGEFEQAAYRVGDDADGLTFFASDRVADVAHRSGEV